MMLEKWRDPANQQDVFQIKIRDSDYVLAELQPFDRLLIKECEKSQLVSDKLLALETIIRRMEEGLELQKKKEEKK